MNNIVISLIDDLFQHFQGQDVFLFPGKTCKRNIVISITEGDLAVCRIFIVISGSNCRLLAHFLKYFQIGKMKMHNMGFDHGCNKEHFFLLHVSIHPQNQRTIPIIIL